MIKIKFQKSKPLWIFKIFLNNNKYSIKLIIFWNRMLVMKFEKCNEIHIQREWNKSVSFFYLLNSKLSGEHLTFFIEVARNVCYLFSTSPVDCVCNTFPWNNTNTGLLILSVECGNDTVLDSNCRNPISCLRGSQSLTTLFIIRGLLEIIKLSEHLHGTRKFIIGRCLFRTQTKHLRWNFQK